MATFNAVNNDTTYAVQGDIVKSSGQNFGVTRALANSGTIGLLGAWTDPSPIGEPGKVSDGLVDVNCSVTVAVGDKLYLSALVPGKATNVAPTYAYFLGTALAVRVFSGVYKATISFHGGLVSLSDTSIVAVTGTPATGTIVCIAAGSVSDNDRFTINDGVNAAAKFEYQKSSNIYATGSVTCVDASLINDNETFVLNDGVHTATTFEFEAKDWSYATGSITAVDQVHLIDNETFVLNDGVHTPTTFEFNVSGAFIPVGGRVTVDVSALVTNIEVAEAIKTAINGVTTTLAITAGTITGATVALVNDAQGGYNTGIVDTVAYSGFTHTGMTGGYSFTPTGGSIVAIDVRGLAAAAVASAVKSAINAITTSLTITAGTITGATIALTNDAYGFYNTAITDTVTDAGFTHVGMTGGSVFNPTSTYTAIDLRTSTTATDVAVATAASITAASLNFVIPVPTTATVTIANTVRGTGGNIAIIKTAGSYSVTGMSGGAAGLI